MNQNSHHAAIESVLILPRNKRNLQYFLNGNEEAHFMSYDDARKFLSELVPTRVREIVDLISRYRNFIVLVEEAEVIELTPDESLLEKHSVRVSQEKVRAFKQQMINKQRDPLRVQTDAIARLSQLGNTPGSGGRGSIGKGI